MGFQAGLRGELPIPVESYSLSAANNKGVVDSTSNYYKHIASKKLYFGPGVNCLSFQLLLRPCQIKGSDVSLPKIIPLLAITKSKDQKSRTDHHWTMELPFSGAIHFCCKEFIDWSLSTEIKEPWNPLWTWGKKRYQPSRLSFCLTMGCWTKWGSFSSCWNNKACSS